MSCIRFVKMFMDLPSSFAIGIDAGCSTSSHTPTADIPAHAAFWHCNHSVSLNAPSNLRCLQIFPCDSRQHCASIPFCSSTNTMACTRHRAGKHLLLSKDWRLCSPAPTCRFTLTHPMHDYCWVATSFHTTCNRKLFKGSSWSSQPFGWNSCYLFASALQMHPKSLSLLSPSFHFILSSQACCFWLPG